MQIPGQTKARCHPLWSPWSTYSHPRSESVGMADLVSRSVSPSHLLISYSLLTTGSDHILSNLVSRPLSRPRTLSCHIFSRSASLESSLYGWFGISLHIMKISNQCHIISTTLAPISNTLKSVFGTHRAPKRAPFDTKHPFWSSQGSIEKNIPRWTLHNADRFAGNDYGGEYKRSSSWSSSSPPSYGDHYKRWRHGRKGHPGAEPLYADQDPRELFKLIYSPINATQLHNVYLKTSVS